MQELADELVSELDARMQADDWARQRRATRVSVAQFAAGHLVTFSHSLKEGFIATATFSWMREDGSSPLVVVGHIGLEYEPADALLAALTDPEILGVVLSEPHVLVEISGADGPGGIAERLAVFVREEARALERVKGIDSVIELLRDGRAVPFMTSTAGLLALDTVDADTEEAEPGDGKYATAEDEEFPADVEANVAKAELIAVLLAVSGRHEEARTVLAEYEPPADEGELVRKYGRFVRRFARFLEADGDLEIPSSPPRVRAEAPPSFPQFFAEKRPEIRAQRGRCQGCTCGKSGQDTR
jgi:hypothetical protein